MVQTQCQSGSNLWIVGAESETQARDMVERNIGLPIISIWATDNARHIAIGELRLAPDLRSSGTVSAL